ncbi:MotA/TolQ/ExbB proton channel family protein [Pseudochelatococcus sp. B33]
MSRLAGVARGTPERADGAARRRAPDFHRLSIYTVCAGLSFALLLAAGGRHSGIVHGEIVFWLLAGFAACGMIVGAVAPAMGEGFERDLAGPRLALGRLPQAAVGVAAVLALLATADGASPVWPSVLVLLFAGRVLVEIADLRLWLAWRAPLRRHPAASVQSAGAALAFGGFLALVFEQAAALAMRTPGVRAVLPQGGDGVPTAASVAVDALLGDTPVHRALIYLFFVVVAFVADAWRLHWRDRAALAALGRLLEHAGDDGKSEGGSDPMLPAALDRLAPLHPGSRALLACRTIADGTDAAALAAFRAVTDFHLASRRFVKSVVPLLPLLGFVGTVIGLSITLGELPRDTGDGVRAAADISASLGGLAIKFQTTLLGLVGGMVASTALNALEKAETELMAECALIVAAAAARPSASVPPPGA